MVFRRDDLLVSDFIGCLLRLKPSPSAVSSGVHLTPVSRM